MVSKYLIAFNAFILTTSQEGRETLLFLFYTEKQRLRPRSLSM